MRTGNDAIQAILSTLAADIVPADYVIGRYSDINTLINVVLSRVGGNLKLLEAPGLPAGLADSPYPWGAGMYI